MPRIIEELASGPPPGMVSQYQQLRVGMTLREAVDAWGMPKTFNRICRANGCLMQYVYPEGRFIYLKNSDPNAPNYGYRVVGWKVD
jgi:hypothetical protein